MPEKPHLHVAAAIIFNNGRVLIARRPPNSRHGGHWEFPGGKQEPGETIEECAVREIAEELDFRIEAMAASKPIPPVRHDYGDFSLTLHPVICRPAGPRPREATSIAWVKPTEIDLECLLPPDRVIALALIKAGR